MILDIDAACDLHRRAPASTTVAAELAELALEQCRAGRTGVGLRLLAEQALVLVGTRKDGDETLGVGKVDVDMLSNLILGRLNSRDRRLASALVMDTEHCFFCIENKRGHRGDDTVRVPPAHTSSVRST